MIKARIVSVVLFSLLAVMFITVTAPTASADTFNLNILNCNCQPTGTNAGTVLITLSTANSVDFVVTLNAPLNFHDTNAFDAFAFNYSGTGALSASLVTANFAFSNVATGNGSMDGAGQHFEFFLDYTGPSLPGGNTGVTVLSFRITSTTPVTLAQFETLDGGSGANNADFAASVSATTASGCTGVVSGGNGVNPSTPSGGSTAGSPCGGTVTTPEPASNLTLGLGLLILGFASRRFIKKASQEG